MYRGADAIPGVGDHLTFMDIVTTFNQKVSRLPDMLLNGENDLICYS